MRLFHLRMKLSASILHFRDGVGVFSDRSLFFGNDDPLLDPQLPGCTHTMDGSACVSKLGIWGARRFATCPVRLESSQGLVVDSETKRKPVIEVAAVNVASDGPFSSTKVSCTWISPWLRTKSNMWAPVSVHRVTE
ncbi:hypothetical protein TcYC6_0080880 [Trypanosoma cruzi]|nr:hypothetical protein TcYC6_0080880 [Trypanosoma cruzi]